MVSNLPSLGVLLWPLALILQPAFSAQYTSTDTATPHDNTGNCTCYVVNSGASSNSPSYFQYYRFFDFRNLADQSGQYVTTPPLVNNSDSAASESVWNANILNSNAWNSDWGIQNWSKPATSDFPTHMVNSPANVFIQQNDDSSDAFTFLTLRTTRLDDFQSASEVENEQKNLMHVSMRMHARVTGSKGAVAGFFTFFDDDNETDVEILTDDPTDTIRYTNQPSVDKDGNEVTTASVTAKQLAPWDEWQTHRIDWLDRNSYWYLNNKQVAANTYSVPRKPSGMTINMWSDGGEWSGNMSVGDSAEFQIQWIEMTFNTSGPVTGTAGGNKRDIELLETRKDKGCKVVCKIDDVQTLGTPEIVSVSRAAEMSVSWGLLVFVGAVALLVGM
ncbi:concanavalin A-like lectin/glucanase [Massarina eburnea CBS 473.64]|uniref:Concanavalin A-like lectin/glucanase n=1 Tax=Massarina eburnea CBS 473.64 TaxID=1395130 RepID=A0A6A6RNC0_9PLEO|nr:concanavalin A-like lectin/glucanase [Massarina eburnea CBS 473.64]